MIVVEIKVKGKPAQYEAINEAIQTAQFVRNKCLRYWMDHRGISRAELYRYNTQLRSEFSFVKALNSHACQASVERCWSAIARFFDNRQFNIEVVWHSAKESVANRLFKSIEELESLLRQLLNEGKLIIKWGRKIKNKGDALITV